MWNAPLSCKGFMRKPKIAKGSIKIASPQNAKRQLEWFPTYWTNDKVQRRW